MSVIEIKEGVLSRTETKNGHRQKPQKVYNIPRKTVSKVRRDTGKKRNTETKGK